MENDFLKSAWKQIVVEDKSSLELKTIISQRGNSLVKKIRKQFIIETIATLAFLIVYYDFFDGDKKPLYANVLLIFAVLFTIIHNILGLKQMKLTVKGENIEESLVYRLHKMKRYALVSGILRILMACSFLAFFVSVITFTQVKYWILSCIILMFLIQISVFIKTWNGRIRRMEEIIENLRANS